MYNIKKIFLRVELMKKFLLKIWDAFHVIKAKIIDLFWKIFDFFYSSTHKPPVVASVEETIDAIVENKASIARFGDGEIKLVAGKNISFQKVTPFAKNKLTEVLSCDVPGLLIGLADIFDDMERYTDKLKRSWNKHLDRYRKDWYVHLKKGKKYYNATMTRQYITLRDRSEGLAIFRKLQTIWQDRDVVFIEGEKSRLGVGNDLFSNVRSAQRILCPSTQAFEKYDEILAEALKIDKDKLILLALGPVATCLAYDLHLQGYQAVDIGHADVEYEWLLMGAEEKVPVKNKMVFEAGFDKGVEDCTDEKYQSEIIAKIL